MFGRFQKTHHNISQELLLSLYYLHYEVIMLVLIQFQFFKQNDRVIQMIRNYE